MDEKEYYGLSARRVRKASAVKPELPARLEQRAQLRRGGKGTAKKCRKSYNNVRNPRNIAIIAMK